MFAYVRKKQYFCSRKSLKLTIMEAAPVKERGASYEPIIGNYEHEVYYTHEEFMNELAKQLGQAYGLNDIREAC